MSEKTRKKKMNMAEVAMLEDSDYSTVMQISQNLIEEAKKTVPETPVVSDLFNCYPEFNEKPLAWYTVKSIGTENTSADNKDKAFSDSCAEFAGLLSYSAEPFAIRCRAEKNSHIFFEIGLYEDEHGTRIKSMLKAVFGIAEIVKSEDGCSGKNSEWHSRCLPIKCTEDEPDSLSFKPDISQWADHILEILAGTDCCVQMLFIPADAGWVKARLDDAYETENNIQKFLKYHRQVSSNYSESINNSENSNKIVSVHKKSGSISEGGSSALSCSDDIVFVDSEVESAEKRVKYFIRLLEQMNQNGWFVRMTVKCSYSCREQAAAARNALGASLGSIGYSCEWSRIPEEKKLASLYLPVHFATSLISLPTKDFVGFSIEELCELNLNLPEGKADDTQGIGIGTLLCNGESTGIPVTIPRSELNRHAFVCGMTGSGKTNTVCSLLSSVSDIHYMVVEPVKGEYHSLPGVRRYTMVTGDENALFMNPFWFPEGSSLQYHIDSLKLIISSAFDLYAAMPNILEQCLYRVYNNCGWDFISGCNIYENELPKEDLYPTFRSLSEEIDRYLDERFSGELQDNYRGALLSRVQSFTTGAKGALLNTTAHIPFEMWAEENVVVELDALADDADKAIVMGALLVQYFQYIKHSTEHKASDGLRHLVVLEEAHHLFQENATKSGEGQNASEQLVKMLNNLLAEIRAYGEGFLIVDQSPSAISTSVLKNTGVKIAHRVDYGEDIKLLESVLLLKEDNKKTAYLDKGEALVRYGSMALPAHVKVPLCKSKEDCVLHKGRTGVVSVSAAYDRILSNESLMSILKNEAVRLLNLLLLEKNYNVISEGFEEFRNVSYRLIVYKCGWENASIFTSGGNYLPLLDSCIVYACENEFPGQYCLCRMIRMYVLRMAAILEESKDGCLTYKEKEVFEDYRANKLYPRITFYYDNDIEPETQSIASVVGSIPELKVICTLVKMMWALDKEERISQFDEIVSQCFIVPPSNSERILLRNLALYYIDECRK